MIMRCAHDAAANLCRSDHYIQYTLKVRHITATTHRRGMHQAEALYMYTQTLHFRHTKWTIDALNRIAKQNVSVKG